MKSRPLFQIMDCCLTLNVLTSPLSPASQINWDSQYIHYSNNNLIYEIKGLYSINDQIQITIQFKLKKGLMGPNFSSAFLTMKDRLRHKKIV